MHNRVVHETSGSRRPDSRRLAEIFGDVLPETTEDERASWGEHGTSGTGDEWYRANRPPHHDRDD